MNYLKKVGKGLPKMNNSCWIVKNNFSKCTPSQHCNPKTQKKPDKIFGKQHAEKDR